ncbi:transposase [Chryseobacterium sp. L7]|uniref:Transposase n=1 Tax=Chryseobacterium endalhagicum TaxID=2797638 RepID=A0ABS1QI85_9FLAO|nr:transposase [Chryseobacterium endalhagicum]MBL1222315.1 transposase [Chryseobacterium endalhagicum]
MNFKNIHIGQMIEKRVSESKIELSRIRKFFQDTDQEICEMYLKESLPTDILLKWSKLLEYDFFRLYTQHLILYASSSVKEIRVDKKTILPQFRKNIYTKEVINFILEQIETGKMTKMQVMERYRIPKTTLYKWIKKYKNLNI